MMIHSEISRIALLSLPEELKADITLRIANMKKVKEGILYQIEENIKEKMTKIHSNPVKETGGIEHTIKILKGIVHDERKKILDMLLKNNKVLAEQIIKKISEEKEY